METVEITLTHPVPSTSHHRLDEYTMSFLVDST